jgi:hypothetical protein
MSRSATDSLPEISRARRSSRVRERGSIRMSNELARIAKYGNSDLDGWWVQGDRCS